AFVARGQKLGQRGDRFAFGDGQPPEFDVMPKRRTPRPVTLSSRRRRTVSERGVAEHADREGWVTVGGEVRGQVVEVVAIDAPGCAGRGWCTKTLRARQLSDAGCATVACVIFA